MMRNDNYTMEELIPLLSELAKKYTSNESTSISYDTAKQLMGSIIFCINETSFYSELLPVKHDRTPQEAYSLGYSLAKDKCKKAQKLFNSIRDSFHSYQNICYYETVIKGMPAFFDWYDVTFSATNHILTLDYPLMHPLQHLEGIDLIYEYLKCIQLEQLFLKKFPIEYLLAHFEFAHKNYKDLIENVCRLPLRYAIGCMIIEQSIFHYHLNKDDLELIKRKIENKKKTELEDLIRKQLRNLISNQFDNNQLLFDYLISDCTDFSYELNFCIEHNCLENIFPIPRKESREQQPQFVEGELMDDEKLRELMDELGNYQTLSDKILIIKDTVSTLTDLKEILKECFYSGEYTEVFKLLSPEEINVLKKEITQKISNYEDLYEWEKAIFSDINTP